MTGAINLGPTGNIQGTHNFLSSKTWDLNVRRKWTELPVLSEVILFAPLTFFPSLDNLEIFYFGSCYDIVREIT